MFGNTFWLREDLCKQFQRWEIVEKRRPSFSANASTATDGMELNSIKQIRLQELFQTDINTRLQSFIWLLLKFDEKRSDVWQKKCVVLVEAHLAFESIYIYIHMVTLKEENYMLEDSHLKSVYTYVLALFFGWLDTIGKSYISFRRKNSTKVWLDFWRNWERPMFQLVSLISLFSHSMKSGRNFF